MFFYTSQNKKSVSSQRSGMNPGPFGQVLFYERALADRVLKFIDRAAASGALVLIGDPQRNYFPKGRFEAVAEYRVPVTRDLEDAEIKKTAVWRLSPS